MKLSFKVSLVWLMSFRTADDSHLKKGERRFFKMAGHLFCMGAMQ